MSRKPLVLAAVCGICLALVPLRGSAQSLGDIARQLRAQRAAEADPPPAKVYTNQDIPKWTDEVTWRAASQSSAATTSTSLDPANPNPPIQVKRQDVECSFFFRAQDMLPAAKPDESGLKSLPASDLARLDGTASIWGERLDVSVHNDTSWQLREVTVRLVTSSAALETPPNNSASAGNSHPADHGDAASSLPAGAPSDAASRLLSLQLDAGPFTAAVSTKDLGSHLSGGEKWSWEIVQAKGIPPASAK
jgi:hypothetical protein